MHYATLAAVLAALVLGFAAGLVTYRQSRRWCPGCGATLRCPTGCQPTWSISPGKRPQSAAGGADPDARPTKRPPG
jgi:hypothetical protein